MQQILKHLKMICKKCFKYKPSELQAKCLEEDPVKNTTVRNEIRAYDMKEYFSSKDPLKLDNIFHYIKYSL